MEVILHPSRALLLAKFPSNGLELNGEAIRQAVKSQLDARGVPDTLNERPSRPGERPITGVSRLFRSENAPYLLIQSYQPDGLAPIPDRETYHAMSFPPELIGSIPRPSVDHADGLLVFGTNPNYTVFVQADDPLQQHHNKGLRDYPGNMMPPTAPDNFKVAAMRTMLRLGLV